MGFRIFKAQRPLGNDDWQGPRTRAQTNMETQKGPDKGYRALKKEAIWASLLVWGRVEVYGLGSSDVRVQGLGLLRAYYDWFLTASYVNTGAPHRDFRV